MCVLQFTFREEAHVETETGLPPGVIFLLRNIHDSVNINQQNCLHRYYLTYINHGGEVIAGHTGVKPLLDLLRAMQWMFLRMWMPAADGPVQSGQGKPRSFSLL